MIVVNFLLGLLDKLLAPLLAYAKGRADEQNKNLKESNKRMANRPRTDNDVLKRLRDWRD